MKKKWISIILLFCIIASVLSISADTKQHSRKDLESNGFVLVQQQYITKEKCYIYQLKHKKTGAVVVFKDNKLLKKSFSIGFASQATDNKGANHVLEHALLSGSEKYPTKNLFMILKGNTVATTLNGYTSDDMVVYLFETVNQQDYQNLQEIYLDMIFHPLMLTDKNIFLREGIRREYSNGKTVYNGVVFNEICTRDDLLNEAVQIAIRQMFPNSIPGFDSGGIPEALKTLSYEDLLEVYNTYYVPSNSITYIAGDVDLPVVLKRLNNIFKDYTNKRPEINFEQSPIKPLNSHYSAVSTAHSGTPGTSCVGTMIAGPKVNNIKDTISSQILMDMAQRKLSEESSSLIYNAGSQGGGILTHGFLAEDVPNAQTGTILTQMHSVFSSFRGMEAKSLIHEINKQETQDALYADNISLVMTDLMTGWIYTDNPLCYMDKSGIFDELRKEAETGYFDTVLERYFIENPYQVDYVISPSNGEESANISEFTATPKEIELIKHETRLYNEWANKLDASDIIDKIPSLNIEDFANPPFDFTVIKEDINGVPYIYTKSKTQNMKENATVSFDISGLDQTQVPVAQMAADFINMCLNTDGNNAVYAKAWANSHRYDNTQYTPMLSISITAESDAMQQQVQSVVDLLKDTDFLDGKMTNQDLKKLQYNAFANMSMYYFYCAFNEPLSKGSLWDSLAGDASGAGGYKYYKYLQKLPDAAAANQELHNIKDQVFNSKGIILAFQGNEESSSIFKSVMQSFVPSLSVDEPIKNKCELPEPIDSYSLIDQSRKGVSAVYQIGSFLDAGTPYTGQMQVLANLLTTNYLQPQIRGAGGAYGTDLRINSNGTMIVSGARTPDINMVLKAFEGMGEYLRTLSITQKELNKFIIPAVNEIDTYFIDWSPNFGNQAFLEGYTTEDVLRERKQILETTEEDLRSYADAIDKIINEKRIFITTNETGLEESGVQTSVTENLQDILSNEVSD